MKRTLSILMTLLLLWSLALPAAAAETATAATLRLEKTEGTVNVSNASGKSVTVTKGMRLYSGYTIATEKDSYAYVSLDSTKAVKLDASSKVEVQKSGKKLELSLISGELFFNVTAPLEKDENLNIRTSTMVTGVRGTSGWVTVTNRFTSSIHLLEGTLTVTSAEPATGQMRQVTITGGQTATATLTGQAQSGSQMALTVTTLQEKQVPGFVAVEVEKDPVLQQKITAKSPLSVPSIIGDAEERLEAEQASANAADQKIQQDLNKIAADEVDQVFQSPVEDDDDDDDDDGGSDVPPANDILTLNNPTAKQLNDALARTDLTRINVTNAGGVGSNLNTASYSVPSGKTLNIQSGTFTVGSGQNLDVEGILNNSGTITIQSNNSVHVKNGGSLTNNGTIQVGGGTNPGLLDIQSGCTLNNNSGGSISIAEKSSVTNAGTFNNSGDFTVNGPGLFTSTGTYTENRANLYAMAKNRSGQVSYLGLAANMPNWYDSTTVTLVGNTSGGSWVVSNIPINASAVTLNLNGKAVTLGSTLSVGTGGELTITGSGSLTASSDAVTVESSGKLTMTGGTVTSTGGTGINVTGGSVEISGGKVSSENGTGINVTGGSVTISESAEVEGATYGIRNVDDGGKVEISGGTVTLTADIPEDGSFSGFAVSGLFTFSGGTLLTNIEESFYTLEPRIPEGSELYCPPDNGNGYFQLTLVRGD